MIYETDSHGVRLALVRIVRNVYFANGDLKVQIGAFGRLASDHDGRYGISFGERPENEGLFIALDGSGLKNQTVEWSDFQFVYDRESLKSLGS